jgi:hypothetical protein
MGGVALSRLWDTHPKIAFPLHILTCAMIGLVALALWSEANRVTAVIIAVLFVIDLAFLVLATIGASQRGWTRE